MPLVCQRDSFTIPDGICYLNAAYMTPFTKAQVMVGQAAVAANGEAGFLTPQDFFTATEETRSLAAKLLGVDANSVAFIPAVSYGIATAARNIAVRAGSLILVLEGQFPSNVYEWRRLADKRGAELKTLKSRPDHDWTIAVLEALEEYGDQIDLLALPHVHWSTGIQLDLEVIAEKARSFGAELVLDLTQSAGAIPINLQKIRPAFTIVASYKWLMGPYGLGVMVVGSKYHGGEPLEEGWISREGSEDFSSLTDYTDRYQSGARRFDMGARAQFLLMPVLKEGLRQLCAWSVAGVEAYVGDVTNRLATGANDMGYKSVPASVRSANILSLALGDKAETVFANMKAAGVHVSLRGQNLRVAPHVWTNKADEDTFLSVLAQK